MNRSWPIAQAALAGVVLVVAILGAALIGLNIGVAIALAVVVIVGAVSFGRWRRGGAGAAGGPGRFASHLGLASVAVFGLIQLVPYGRDHDNPPVIAEPPWANDETRDLMVRACFGCHSNEVEWPWYSNVAPLSWAVQRHVDEGRDEVNYSEFGQGHQEYDDTIETILDGEMPPGYYTRFGLHSEADLSDDEVATLVAGLRATPGLDEDEDEHAEREDDDEHDEDEDDD